MPTTREASPVAIWAALLTLYVVWGSTYLAIRWAIDSIPPYLMISLRFFLAGGILLAWNAARGELARGLPTRRELVDSAIVGTLLLCGGMGLVAWAELTVPTGIVALLVALMPAWVALFGRIFFGERLVPLVVVGLVVGFVGVGLLIAPGLAAGAGSLDPLGVAAVIVGPTLWASGSLYSAHRARLPRVPSLASACQMLAAAVVALIIAAFLGEYGRFDPAAITTRSIGALAYLVVVGSIVGFGAYVWLLRVAPLPKVTTYAYVNPVVAFILGAVALAEPITPTTVVAAAVIVVGVALIVTARGRGTGGSPEETALAEEAAMAEAEGAGGAAPAPTHGTTMTAARTDGRARGGVER